MTSMGTHFLVSYSHLLNKLFEEAKTSTAPMVSFVCFKMLWEYYILLYKHPHLLGLLYIARV